MEKEHKVNWECEFICYKIRKITARNIWPLMKLEGYSGYIKSFKEIYSCQIDNSTLGSRTYIFVKPVY